MVTREATCICQFITDNHALLHLRWKKALFNHQKVSKYYKIVGGKEFLSHSNRETKGDLINEAMNRIKSVSRFSCYFQKCFHLVWVVFHGCNSLSVANLELHLHFFILVTLYDTLSIRNCNKKSCHMPSSTLLLTLNTKHLLQSFT